MKKKIQYSTRYSRKKVDPETGQISIEKSSIKYSVYVRRKKAREKPL